AAPHRRGIPVLRDLTLQSIEEARVHPALRGQRSLVAAIDILEVIDGATAERALERLRCRLQVRHLRRATARALRALLQLALLAALLLDRSAAVARHEAIRDERSFLARRRALLARLLRRFRWILRSRRAHRELARHLGRLRLLARLLLGQLLH